MRQYVTDYLNFIDKLIADYNSNAQVLKADDREDESVLFKVRANICDIFSKMVAATDKKLAAKKTIAEEEQIRLFNQEYLDWFEKIPANWKSNLEMAKKHDDIITVQTEEIKLETAQLLRQKFLELTGDTTLLQQEV